MQNEYAVVGLHCTCSYFAIAYASDQNGTGGCIVIQCGMSDCNSPSTDCLSMIRVTVHTNRECIFGHLAALKIRLIIYIIALKYGIMVSNPRGYFISQTM